MSHADHTARMVRALLETFGYNVTFRRVTEGAYDPSTGQTAAATTSDETVRAAFLNYKAREVDGTIIQRGDRKVVLSSRTALNTSLSKEPQVGDQFVGEGRTVTVVHAEKINMNGTVVGYICQARY